MWIAISIIIFAVLISIFGTKLQVADCLYYDINGVDSTDFSVKKDQIPQDTSEYSDDIVFTSEETGSLECDSGDKRKTVNDRTNLSDLDPVKITASSAAREIYKDL